MSRKIPVICENCNHSWYVKRWDEYAECPLCRYVTDIFGDGWDDRRPEDEQ